MSSSRPVSSCRMWAPRWQLNIWFTVSGSLQSRQPGSSMAPNLARSALDSEEWPVRSWFHVTSSHLLRNFYGRFFMVVAQFWRYLLYFSLRSFLMTALAVLSVSGRISWARWVASPAATSAHSLPSSPQIAGTQTKVQRPIFSTAFHMMMPQLVSWASGPVASLLSEERESVIRL